MNLAYLLLAGALALGMAPASAADAPPGAAACSGCHAASPAVETPVPRIHGRPAAGTIAAMEEFRTGKRPATVMDRLARGFSESETRAIAEWLAAQ